MCLESDSVPPTLADRTTTPQGSDKRSQEARPMSPSTSRPSEHDASSLSPATEEQQSLTRRQRLILETITAADIRASRVFTD